MENSDGLKLAIERNLLYLTDHITNLNRILLHLIEKEYISQDDADIIESADTDSKKCINLLKTLKRIELPMEIFLFILKKTYNPHCAKLIQEFNETQKNQHPSENASNFKKARKQFNWKWWPEEKKNPNSFYKRKEKHELLTVKLKQLLTTNDTRKTIFNRHVAVCGLGGVGKSATAKWFADEYENKYDYIFWLDCGDNSLLKSFTKLARSINFHLMALHGTDLKEISIGCFEKLKAWNCLFIFDNADCYVGLHGIKDALPSSSYKSFHSIITSRNQEWGQEHMDGKLPQLTIKCFETNEGVDFISRNLKHKEKRTTVESLCKNLGNALVDICVLPDSLQRLRLRDCRLLKCSKTFTQHLQLNKLQELSLLFVTILDDESNRLLDFDISHLILTNIISLTVDHDAQDKSGGTCLSISFSSLKNVTHLDLSNSKLIVSPGIQIAPIELSMHHITIIDENQKVLTEVVLNEYIDFKRMTTLVLVENSQRCVRNRIDLAESLTLDYVALNQTDFINWKNANWTVRKLELNQVDFVEKSEMVVTEMSIHESSVDTSVLPHSLQKLHLWDCTLTNCDIKLPPNLLNNVVVSCTVKTD